MSLLSLRPGKVGGAETYVRNLVRWLPEVAGSDELALVGTRETLRTIDARRWRALPVDWSDTRLVSARVLEAFTPWRARSLERAFDGFDAVLFPQQTIFPRAVRAAAVLSVGDVQHLFFPHYFGAFDRAFRAAVYPRSMEHARRIIAVSQFTRATLTRTAAIDGSRIAVIPYGVSPKAAAAREPLASLPPRYLYYPAATFAHKGHATLFRTYAALRAQGAVDEPLLLTGAKTAHWKHLQRLVRELGLERDVVHLGYLPYADVQQVYASATAVLFPSEFEGFGLPVVEAVEHGRKVIVSRLEVFEEIGVPDALRIDFSDPAQLLAALRLPGPTVLDRPPLTWEETARLTLAELRRAAG